MLSSEIILGIRKLKTEGYSIEKIAKLFECSKSTVSYYCRDLFENNQRIHKTEVAARKKIQQASKKKHPCGKCGKAINIKSTLCRECFLKNLRSRINYKRAEKNICLNSSNGAHYWIINSINYGKCKYCGEERQFRTMH